MAVLVLQERNPLRLSVQPALIQGLRGRTRHSQEPSPKSTRRSPESFYAIALVLFTLAFAIGYGGIYYGRLGESKRKTLKGLDLASYSFSVVAVLAAIGPLTSNANELIHILSKSAEFHALFGRVAPQPRDQIEEYCRRLLYRTYSTADKNKECEELMRLADQFEFWDLSGQKVSRFSAPTDATEELKGKIREANGVIDSYNAQIDELDRGYERDKNDIRLITVLLLFVTGISASIAFGLGLSRRIYEYRAEE